ncbi:urease accessory protein [Halarchaeum rubridurum]|uniref:Urease accessory protein n=1 Tax=Halarchaeum rubridurum TaxID=489911 RepID=A0A830FYM0_9EURY|nr:urease accessory protein UreE [Halarchaeum rubridurum]MBP1954542.1 urease accessory protein [Halarchaeum rubridurum]GGM61922.1 hypothetical protein GCM10009017_09980 [Halarchaeum rubridurum]
MELYDTYLGNERTDDDVAARVAASEDEAVRRVTLDETTRRRSRFRTEAADGTDVGVVATDAGSLEPGDVLAGEDDGLLVVALAAREALVVSMAEATATPETMALAAKLGHVVGNRHRDLAVRGSDVLIAVAESTERQRAEVEGHLPEGATVGVETVDPTLFDDATPEHGHDSEGGHGPEGHGHTHGDEGHDHGHDDEHTHAHDGDGHSHARGGVRTPGTGSDAS